MQPIFVLEVKNLRRVTPEILGYFLSIEAAREAAETLLKREGRGTKSLNHYLKISEISTGLINFLDNEEAKEWPLKPELVHECPCGQGQCYVDDEGKSGCDF